MRRVVAALVLVTAWSHAAFAQGPVPIPAEDQTTQPEATQDPQGARDLGRAGLDAYGQGDFERALDLFRQAEALAHSPVFRLYAARCLVSLGKMDEARAEFEAVLASTPSEGAPEAWLRARGAAQDELAALPKPANGEPATETKSPERYAEPHVVRVVSGEMPPPGSHPEPVAPRSYWQRATPEKRGALVAFGVGTVGLVFAAVTGGLALVESAAVKANCTNNVCPAEDLPRAQYAMRLADLATVGVGVTLAGGVTGAVLWLLPDDRGQARVALSISGPSLRLNARF